MKSKYQEPEDEDAFSCDWSISLDEFTEVVRAMDWLDEWIREVRPGCGRFPPGFVVGYGKHLARGGLVVLLDRDDKAKGAFQVWRLPGMKDFPVKE